MKPIDTSLHDAALSDTDELLSFCSVNIDNLVRIFPHLAVGKNNENLRVYSQKPLLAW